jgi:type VI secretion system secreted protein Hcp
MRRFLTLSAALIVLAFTLAARADIYVHIEGLKGDATAREHVGAINALRYSLEISAAVDAGAGEGAVRAVYKPLVITKEIDSTSPRFLHAVSTGEHFKTLTLVLVKPDAQGREFVTFTARFEHPVISSVRHYTDEHGLNLEEVAITYRAIEFGPPSEAPKAPDNPVIRIPLPTFNR